jgi:hypothetical protein
VGAVGSPEPIASEDLADGGAVPDDGLSDDPPKYTEPLERLRLVMANVNTSNPDVRVVLAHTATAVAAVLEDSADRVNDNDKLAAKVRRLEKRLFEVKRG